MLLAVLSKRLYDGGQAMTGQPVVACHCCRCCPVHAPCPRLTSFFYNRYQLAQCVSLCQVQ